MRLIDADELEKQLIDYFTYSMQLCAEISDFIDNALTIELEIVRCKDCTHWSHESICDGFCSEDCMRHDEDFYCGYAERKTNE